MKYLTYTFFLLFFICCGASNSQDATTGQATEVSFKPSIENANTANAQSIKQVSKAILDTIYPEYEEEEPEEEVVQPLYKIKYPRAKYLEMFQANDVFYSDGFDFPVGWPDADGYFKANRFGQRHHLGEDWNGVGGGNSDLGDPVYSTADGLVTFTKDVCCGWGKVMRIIHCAPDGTGNVVCVESVYAHLNEFYSEAGDFVSRGELIGEIGTGGGRYSAHLHFEIRSFVNMALGPGYSEDQHGYVEPTAFIKLNRP